jgi:hypothetical protein
MSFKYVRKKNIIFSEIDGEVVLLHSESGKYFSFNKVGSHIWLALEKPLTIHQLKDILMQKYDVDEAKCLKEIEDFLNNLLEKKLIDVYKD